MAARGAGRRVDQDGSRYADRWAMVERLDREWVCLVDRSAGQLTGWGERANALTGCADLAAVLQAVRDDPDAALLALLRLTRDGDALAARTVLQAMVGKMVLMAARTPGAVVADFFAELWPVIATYPVDRRPRRVAANLALDTLKAVTGGRGAADLSWDSVPELVEAALVARRRSEGGAVEVLRHALDLDLIDQPTEQTLSAVYLGGLTSAEAGELLGASAATVRFRCSRAVRRLAQAATMLTEAA